jgi:MFS family permease
MSETAARESGRELRPQERRTLLALGLPTFGLALAITVVSTYVPPIARHFISSTVVIGLIIGAEGIAAILIPIAVGTWSDRVKWRLGGRLPFVLAGCPVAALALLALGLAGSIAAVVVAVGVFFLAYFVAYGPYRSLYPDLLDDEIEGRAQSSQAVARGLGTLIAVSGGGALLAIAQILPFAGAAAVLVACVAAFAVLLVRQGVSSQEGRSAQTVRQVARDVIALLRDRPQLRTFLLANALWELTLAVIKTFVVLWITVGLHKSLSLASAAIGATALLILAAAAVAGKLADRHGRERVLRLALWLWGLGMVVPILLTTPVVLAAIAPLIAFGGGVTMALPYALLAPMMPQREHGTITGLYSVSRGVGIVLGPLLAGAAIQLLRGTLTATHGYGAMWAVAAIATLGSIPALRRATRTG